MATSCVDGAYCTTHSTVHVVVREQSIGKAQHTVEQTQTTFLGFINDQYHSKLTWSTCRGRPTRRR
jgi:hypothetical protein